MKPRIAIIHGEPAGIGPELIAKLLTQADVADHADIVLVGDRHIFELGQRQAGTEWPIREILVDDAEIWEKGDGYPLVPMETLTPEEVRPSEVTEAGGRASLRNPKANADSEVCVYAFVKLTRVLLQVAN